MKNHLFAAFPSSWKRVKLLTVGMCLSFMAIAQEPLEISPLSGEFIFDGLPNEAFWGNHEVEAVQHQPNFMGDPQGSSRFFITYDDQYVYVAGILTYDEDSPIRAISKKRDSFDGGNDYFGIAFDSYNDNENALGFFTTPAGLRWDGAVFNDAQGDFPINVSWNTFWDVKTELKGRVWYTEMRIPHTSLKFQDINGEATMGVTIWWWSASMGQTMIFPPIERNWGGWSAFKPSKFQKVKFKNIYSKNPVYIAPYIITGHQRDKSWDANLNTHQLVTDNLLNAGLDMKIGLSAGFTLDLTANTDFAQVEADNQQVNLTRFSLFFPEKRLFFQERSSVFSVNTGGFNQLFYSRRIGLDADANIVPILGGARIIGRSGKWDFGLIDMQTANTDGQQSSNYGLLRARRQMGNTNSYLGAMMSNQLDLDGNHDLTAGIDGIFDLSNSNYLTVVSAIVDDTTAGTSPLSRSKHYMFLEKRSLFGLLYDVTYAYIGENFSPAMGFELRNNNHQLGGSLGWGWMSPEASHFLNHWVRARSVIFKNLTDGINDSEQHTLSWFSEGKDASNSMLRASVNKEFIREVFDIYGSEIQPGAYTYSNISATYTSKAAGIFYLESNATYGNFFDGQNFTINLKPFFKPSSFLTFNINYQYVNLNFPGVERDNDIHFMSSTLEVTPTKALTFSVLSQYNNYDKQIFTNFRFRYNPKEGNDLFLVINDLENTQINRFFPEMTLPNYENRTVILKYIYTFSL